MELEWMLRLGDHGFEQFADDALSVCLAEAMQPGKTGVAADVSDHQDDPSRFHRTVGHAMDATARARQSASTTASCLTGKFTELAMKHLSWASRCSAVAFSTISGEVTVTRGLSTTSVK
jgi:hypothetical protein